MEIGLTAKVKPEIDERESDRQASKLQSKMEEAVSDLPATMDLDTVLDRTEEMKNNVEEMTSSLENVASVPMPDGGVVSAGGGAQAGPQMPDQGMGGFGRDGQDQQGGGFKDKLQQMADQQGGVLSQMANLGNQQAEQNGLMGRIGKILLGGAAAIAVTGLALQYLGGMLDKLASTSPLLAQVVDMIGLAMSLFLRPIATTLGQFLLPLATGMLQLASEFNTVFQEEGIADALAFLSMEILTGLANMVLSVDVIGGLMDLGGMAIFGSDGEFGIADAFRIAIIGAIGKVAIGKILSKGILSMLPRITAARVINWLVFPKLGTLIANRLGSTLMKASITEILEAGFRQLLQRAFGPVVAKASFSTLWKAAFATLRSKIPSLGIKAFISRIIPSLGGGAAKAMLTRLIPKIGVSSLLKRLGLSAAIKLLTGRLAYFIPVVGQAIAIIDLLTMIITALIPGMEMFSPINWLLVQLWNLLKWIVGGLADLGSWIVGGIMDGFSWLANFNWGSLIPNISVDSAMSFGEDLLEGILDTIDSIWQWFLSAVQPVLDFLQPVFMLLGIFAALGMQFYEMMMKGWKKLKKWLGGMWEALKNLSFDDITSALGNMGGAALEGAIDLAEWVGSGIGSLADWVGSGIGSLADWVASGLGSLASWVLSGLGSLAGWVMSGLGSLASWVTSGLGALSSWVLSGLGALSSWVLSGLGALSSWVASGLGALSSWVADGIGVLADWVADGIGALYTWVTAGLGALYTWVTAGLGTLSSWVTSGLGMLSSWVTSGLGALSGWVSSGLGDFADWVSGTIDIADYVVGSIESGMAEANPMNEGSTADNVVDDTASFVDPRQGWKWTGLASGGIVTGPTTALIGEGGENEAVLPLSKLQSFIESPEMVGGDQGVGRTGDKTLTVDINIDQGEDTTTGDIANEISNAIGDQLSSIEASIDELARKIAREGMVGDIKITADGKVVAEVSEDGKDKYKRTREVNK